MTDAELMAMPPPSVTPVADTTPVVDEVDDTTLVDETTDDTTPVVEDVTTETDDAVPDLTLADDTTTDDVPPVVEDDTVPVVSEPKGLLYEPFKANGRMMQVHTEDDALTLMKKGANYDKKMHIIKPHLKSIRSLQDNGIESQDELNFLIDLHNRKPEAIAKLMADSGVDPLTVDTQGAADYTPVDHSVSDSEYALKDVLDELKTTPSYTKTLAVVNGGWDADSTQFLLDNPVQLKNLNDQIESGDFDRVTGILETERMLGRFQGVPDIEAYIQISTNERAGGAAAPTGDANPSNVPANQSASPSTNQAVSETERANAQRLAAAAPKNSPVKKAPAPAVDNIAAMSDEDFMKAINRKY